LAFLAAPFILFPTVEKMIDGLIGQSVQGVDLVVRRQNLRDVEANGSVDRTEEIGRKLRAVPGVSVVQPMIYDSAAVTSTSGEKVGAGEAATCSRLRHNSIP
jgi:hypothetical protein